MVALLLMFLIDADWSKPQDKDGIIVKQRATKDSSFDEYLLTAESPLSAQVIAETLWDYTAYPGTLPFVRSVKVIEKGNDEFYAYHEIAMPVLKDRDYCLRYFKATDEKTGVTTITSDVDDSKCPKERPEYIRIHKQHASWTLSPKGDGTRLVYQVHSDIEGHVPASFVNMGAASEHAKFVMAVLKAAKARKK